MVLASLERNPVYDASCFAETANKPVTPNKFSKVDNTAVHWLDRTGHMSLLTRQDQTPKFAGPD